MTIPPNSGQSIIDSVGKMLQTFRTWTQEVSRAVPSSGVGSPEGVIEALPTAQYMDDEGLAGSIWYVKQKADIGGDKSLGWVAIG